MKRRQPISYINPFNSNLVKQIISLDNLRLVDCMIFDTIGFEQSLFIYSFEHVFSYYHSFSFDSLSWEWTLWSTRSQSLTHINQLSIPLYINTSITIIISFLTLLIQVHNCSIHSIHKPIHFPNIHITTTINTTNTQQTSPYWFLLMNWWSDLASSVLYEHLSYLNFSVS